MKPKIRLISKILFSVFLALFLWEVILQTTLLKNQGYVVHPILGRIYKAGTYVHGSEGHSRTFINRLGMRDNEIPAKQQNEFRILALGDSYTEAFQVSDEDTYVKVLQCELAAYSNMDIRTINAGKSGASPANYIYLSDFYKNTFEPDYVIVQLNEGDFTKDMLNTKAQFYVKQDPISSYKVVKQLNSNVKKKSFIDKYPQLKFFEDIYLSTIKLGESNFKMLRNRTENEDEDGAAPISNIVDSDIINWAISELGKSYPRVLIVFIPSIDYHVLDKKPSETELLINAAAKKNDITLINMRNPFIDHYRNTLQPAHGFNNSVPGTGHTNSIGHKLIAREIANYLKVEAMQ